MCSRIIIILGSVLGDDVRPKNNIFTIISLIISLEKHTAGIARHFVI